MRIQSQARRLGAWLAHVEKPCPFGLGTQSLAKRTPPSKTSVIAAFLRDRHGIFAFEIWTLANKELPRSLDVGLYQFVRETAHLSAPAVASRLAHDRSHTQHVHPFLSRDDRDDRIPGMWRSAQHLRGPPGRRPRLQMPTPCSCSALAGGSMGASSPAARAPRFQYP